MCGILSPHALHPYDKCMHKPLGSTENILFATKYHLMFTYIQCILLLSKFFYSPTDVQVNCLKTILKFALKFTVKQL